MHILTLIICIVSEKITMFKFLLHLARRPNTDRFNELTFFLWVKKQKTTAPEYDNEINRLQPYLSEIMMTACSPGTRALSVLYSCEQTAVSSLSCLYNC